MPILASVKSPSAESSRPWRSFSAPRCSRSAIVDSTTEEAATKASNARLVIIGLEFAPLAWRRRGRRHAVWSISLWLRPRHSELVATAHVAVTPEVEPERCDDVEAHHGAELRAISEEDREVGRRAKHQEHDRRQRV